MDDAELTIWTIGHSTRPVEEFIGTLRGAGIGVVVDVRRFPGSRRHPQFGGESLRGSLREAGIGYEHMEELGGRRRAAPDSRNTAWRNASFRGYADYMETAEFAAGLERLLGLVRVARVAIMCAEAVWWRCHRGLIADALKVRGVRVEHIFESGKVVEHPYTGAARVVGGRLSYEGDGGWLWEQGRGPRGG